MENKIEKALDSFVNDPPIRGEQITPKAGKTDSTKKVILDEREGLIERVDKILVTKDGKQLLREQY
jgi:hypothetical protein